MGYINKIINKTIPRFVRNSVCQIFRDTFENNSYSQEGEDLILKRFFESKYDKGFYVDVGAHHPSRFSNTYLFYKKGWRGINIDALPGSGLKFKEQRKGDIFVEALVSDADEEVTYYLFEEPALNTIEKELANERVNAGHKILEKYTKKTHSLGQILEENMPSSEMEIDFLSVDVEGADFAVLRSNNWEKYKPKMILVELLSSNFENIKNDNIYRYLKEKGYSLYAKTINTYFFIKW